MPTEPAPTPFRIVIIAELLPRPEFALAHDPPRTPVPITRASFDEVMRRFAPSLSIDLPGSTHRAVELEFSRLRAFRPEWLAQHVPELNPAPVPAAPRPAPQQRGPRSLLDQLLDDQERSPSEPAPVARLAQTQPSALVASVIAHPEVRRLEAVWRGVKFVVDASPAKAPVRVEVLQATPDAVAQALEGLRALPPDDDGASIGLVIVDAQLGATVRDRDRLVAWARGAEALRAPVVTTGSPELLGFETLEALATSSRGLVGSDDPRAALFRTVAADEASRWLVVALNGVLARPRHSKETAREGVVVLETGDLFFGAAYGVAALVADSVQRTGAPFAHAAGTLANLPARLVRVGETEHSLSLEAAVRADVAAEGAKAGVAVFCAVANRDVAVLPWVPMVFRGPTTESGASRQASVTLGDQLFAAAALNAVSGIAEAIPANTDPKAAREAAVLLLATALTFDGVRAELEVDVGGSPRSLDVTVRPGRIAGVTLQEISFAAPLGENLPGIAGTTRRR
jgi:hypothetical protein